MAYANVVFRRKKYISYLFAKFYFLEEFSFSRERGKGSNHFVSLQMISQVLQLLETKGKRETDSSVGLDCYA